MIIKIHGIDYELNKTYTPYILDCFQMYYSGLSIKLIAKRKGLKNAKIESILLDSENKELKQLHEYANQKVFEQYHNKNGVPKLGCDYNDN